MTLRKLFEDHVVALALLPEKNDYLLNEKGIALRAQALQSGAGHTSPAGTDALDLHRLDKLDGYTVPLIEHDYGAKTPLMWNTLYEKLGLNVRNIMVVADKKDAGPILETLLRDPKYLGGGAGVGFKEEVLPSVHRVPDDLQSVNIIVKRDGALYGHNTDAPGFVMSLEEELAKAGKTLYGANIALYGAGGVAKEVARVFGRKGVANLAIVNRTATKAVALAAALNTEFPKTKTSRGMTTVGVGENCSRGILLNSTIHPDAVVNTTDKGSDKFLDTAFFVESGEKNETHSRDILRYLHHIRPDTVIADIVLPAGGKDSISLRFAAAEGFTQLINGVPMVIYQAVPAYRLVEKANPGAHPKTLSDEELLSVFKGTTGKK